MTISEVGNVVSYQVSVAGSPIPDTYEVHAIHVEQGINRIATARITLLDGDVSTETFAISASSTFVPGNEISISAGYDGSNAAIFSGIITRQALKVANGTGPLLEIECKDKAVKMTVGRKSSAASKVTDSDFMTTLIGNAAGVTANVSASSDVLPELVQYYVSDWDFLLARAEINGMLTSTINNTVNVFDPTANTASSATFTYGVDILAFDAEINAITQLPQVTASAWDYQNQQVVQAQAANTLAGPGNLSSKTLSAVIGLSTFNLQTSAAEPSSALSGWARAQMLKSELSKITGTVRVQGGSTVVLGSYLTLAGLGARFDGDHFISKVQHEINDGNWITEYQLGMSPVWFVQEHAIEAPPAAGVLPGIAGLHTGTVKQIDSDPDNEYRILVENALFNDQGAGLRARLANFYSTNGEGVFFLPEVGDEVVLGFLNQDPRYPVILGSMYSQKNVPFSQFAPNAKNSMKGIVSKSQLQILFDDTNKILTLITPAKNTLVLDDQGTQIELKDQNGNSIVMSSSGIAIKSNQSISLEAGQAISIKGATGVTVASSGGDVSTSGININEKADMAYAAKGSMTAEVQGGTMLTLKAAMVMIN